MAPTAYNDALGGVSQAAEQIAFGGLDDRSMAQVAHEAASFRFLMSQGLPRVEAFASAQIHMRDTKIAELSEELSQFKGAVPGYSPSADTGSEPVSMDEMSHLEAAKTIDFAAG